MVFPPRRRNCSGSGLVPHFGLRFLPPNNPEVVGSLALESSNCDGAGAILSGAPERERGCERLRGKISLARVNSIR
jgi:hypothetical protein